jgi:hypothetical protein
MNIIETNQWAIATPTKKGGWRRVPDTRFNDQDSAHAYGKKYHTSKIFGPQYKVIPHPDNLKEESMNEETKWVKDKYGSGYTSSDGKRAIVKHPKGWISRSTTDKHDYSDVYPTQREAKAGKYAWAMKNEESIDEAAKPGAEHFKTIAMGNGEHEVHWKGKRTPYTIFNGSMGASGFGNNIYGIHHKKTGVTRASGTLQQMKSVIMKALHNDESKASLEESKMQSFGQFMEDGVGGAGGVGSGVGGLGSVVDKSGNVQSPPVFPAAQKRIVKKGTPMFRRKLDV